MNEENELYNSEWVKVCKKFQKFDGILPESELMPYQINELGMNISGFQEQIERNAPQLYAHICKVCCLDNYTDDVDHWRKEIFTFTNKILKKSKIKGNIKKDKSLDAYLIKPYVSLKTYKPYSDEMFIAAMEQEMYNARRDPNNIRLKKESESINKYILPNITKFRVANEDRIATLISGIYDVLLNERSEDDLNNVIYKFIDDKVEVDI